jgi:hydrogenase nickel incorporation protein HypB
MCATCGCSDDSAVSIVDLDVVSAPQDHSSSPHAGANPLAGGHIHGHNHEHGNGSHDHHENEAADRLIVLEQQVLAKNDRMAAHNRGWLEGRRTLAVNLMSSPGSGKTTLLERTIRELSGDFSISVVEGDQATMIDASRIKATGCRVVQVNTGAGCHLDADMVYGALNALDPPLRAVVVIENVGNLVCPALFDLGENARVVVVSVTEGQDKPLKYPHMFRTADLVLLNKVDLLPYVDFDVDAFTDAVKSVRPGTVVRQVSATKGTGMSAWYQWLGVRARSLTTDRELLVTDR